MTNRGPIGSALLLALLFTAPAAGQVELDKMKAQTVKITVTHPDRKVEYGSGVVLCQVDEKVYVLTAHHVLAGKSDQPGGRNPLRLRRISEAEISFHGGRPEPVTKEAFEVFQVPGEDLLLLRFPLEHKLQPTTVDKPATVDEAAAQEDRPVVISIGYWKDKAENWADRQGTLLPGGGKLVHHSGDIAEGFSGGPLFNEAGSLIGINIERVSGEAIGAEIGSRYGEALAVQQILPAIDKHMSTECLRSASPISELAYPTYRKAMRAVSIKRWEQAAELMARAIEQQPREGGSVHLEGLRYTPYLPTYHLGLALYKQAERTEGGYQAAKLYAKAIRQWERAEVKGEVQKNKRYKSLKRLEEKSYKALERLAPKTEAEKADWQAAAKAAEKKRAADEAGGVVEPEPKREKKEAAEGKTGAEEAKGPANGEPKTGKKNAPEQKEAAEEMEGQPEAEAEREAERELQEEAGAGRVREIAEAARPCARLRAQPSPGSARLDCLEPGSAVTLLEERDDWGRIRLEDGREGWMAARLLERVDERGEP